MLWVSSKYGMSVVSVDETFRGRTGQDDDKNVRTYNRVFQVLTDDPDTEMADILADTNVPDLGSQYFSDTGALCRSRQATQQDDPLWWEVTCEFSTQNAIADFWNANPLLRSPQYKLTSQGFSKSICKDKDDVAILNSAKIPFDDVQIDASLFILSITKNLATFDITDVLDWKDAVNDDVWNGYPARTLRITSISLTGPEQEGGVTYYVLEISFLIDPLTHDLSILDQGVTELKLMAGPNPEWVPVRDAGQIVSEPRLLDGTGLLLDPGADPVFLPFRVYKELDYSTLPL